MDKTKIIFLFIIGLLLVIIAFRYFYFKEETVLSEEILIGKIVEEPDVRETNTKLTVKVSSSKKILITVARYPEYFSGDILEIKGNLETVENPDYKRYLRKESILAVMYYPSITLKERNQPLGMKEALRKNINNNLPVPQSSILGALILGDKNRISNSFKEKLNIAGIRHLTAISGLHIVILSSILISLFLSLGFWRRQAIVLSLIFIFFFIALTGFQTSSIRAGIMGSLFLIAPLFGRKPDSIRALVLAGLIMLAINHFLIYDTGFQLSFAAASGIIFLSPGFKKYLKSEILTATFSAYIFTLPILIYSFNRISLIGPLTNLLILPVVPILMILGFIASILGFQILFFPVWFLLTYIVKITEVFSEPYFAQEFINIHWFWIVAFYLILFPVAKYFKKKEIKV